MPNYREINHEVMLDTVHQYTNTPELQEAIRHSVNRQVMVAHESSLAFCGSGQCTPRILISAKRTFEAAKSYRGRKVAVLNFANNHRIGGAPFAAGAQEESLCRCSTLYPCLQAMNDAFYERHIRQYQNAEINYMGNDDLIYTPDVVVFKTDERTEPIYPRMLPREAWYKVDVITCAAPELWAGNPMPADYEAQIRRRIKRILDVAALAGAEVLILGAWGCGAFCNPADVVARVFLEQLANYHFETVKFALSHRGDLSENSFARALGVLPSEPVGRPAPSAKTVVSYKREYTPDHIQHLNQGEIFVFGSNIRGIHGGGAAAFAHARFGAEWGVGEGLTGQCYALPTMEGGVDYIGSKVQNFLRVARQHPELRFFVTPVACGIAGFRPEQIAPLFRDALPLPNVILPKDFVRILLA